MRRGELYICDLNPVVGHEQGGRRPVLVMSGPAFGHIPGLFLGLPLTTTDRGLIHHVPVPADKMTGLRTASFVMTEQIRVLSTRRLVGQSIGVVPRDTFARVEYALKVFLEF